MIGRTVRILIAVVLLTLVWGYSNAIGSTQTFNRAVGTNIPTTFKIPYIDQQWAAGKKDVPPFQVIALETVREAGRQNLPKQGVEAAFAGAKKAGLSAKEMKAEYDKGLAEYEANNPTVTAAPTPPAAGKTSTQLAAAQAYSNAQTLTVKGRAPKTGYARDQFGSGWATVKGCDMRNRVLARDLKAIKFKPGSTCVVDSGVLNPEPYTGNAINFVRGNKTSSAVQIDHLVALSDAWQKGAQQWSPETRKAFANDPANLLSTDGPANMGKGDGDTATWLPKNVSFRCTYVRYQVNVKKKYDVWVTKAEQDAMLNVLSKCL